MKFAPAEQIREERLGIAVNASMEFFICIAHCHNRVLVINNQMIIIKVLLGVLYLAATKCILKPTGIKPVRFKPFSLRTDKRKPSESNVRKSRILYSDYVRIADDRVPRAQGRRPSLTADSPSPPRDRGRLDAVSFHMCGVRRIPAADDVFPLQRMWHESCTTSFNSQEFLSLLEALPVGFLPLLSTAPRPGRHALINESKPPPHPPHCYVLTVTMPPKWALWSEDDLIATVRVVQRKFEYV
ncbi:unnamed protein product [Leptidea sinapis]|uniref:Uncharacterized protein n=1 Tax=Leptidea sinapis TaxID=189913 RepID=A0A5E4R1X9_9NEOP|nr:unnamed protein product [Leptidea sinapis]